MGNFSTMSLTKFEQNDTLNDRVREDFGSAPRESGLSASALCANETLGTVERNSSVEILRDAICAAELMSCR